MKQVLYYAHVYTEMNLSCLQDVIELSLNQKLCVVVCLLYTAGYTDVKRSNQGLSDCVYYFRFGDACHPTMPSVLPT